jgi:hypothetical protein
MCLQPASFHDVTPAFHHSIPQYLTASRRALAYVPVRACLCVLTSIHGNFPAQWTLTDDEIHEIISKSSVATSKPVRFFSLLTHANVTGELGLRVLAQFFRQISPGRFPLQLRHQPLLITTIHVHDASHPSRQRQRQGRCIV